MAGEIKIDGLAAWSRSLRKLDQDLPKSLRLAMNRAADVVIDNAKPRVPVRTGRARKSIKARSTRTLVRVSEGGRGAEYVPWLDWGGRVGRKKSVMRARVRDGRFLYPAYYHVRDSGEFQKVLNKELRDVARQAGLKVT
jgi:hypothetical protein